jgi:hypothetical protein
MQPDTDPLPLFWGHPWYPSPKQAAVIPTETMNAQIVNIKLFRLRMRLQRALKLDNKRMVRRAADPYATHVPVLVALSQVIKVRRVLELGCGRYSTFTFLDQSVFADLVALDSFEDDPAWHDSIKAMAHDDPRLTLTLIDKPMCAVVNEVALEQYDLVLVDDSTRASDRAATIHALARRRCRSSIVVMHDYEVQEYREAALFFAHSYRFGALNPNTGVAWNQARLDRHQLAQAGAVITRYASHTQPADRGRWKEILCGRESEKVPPRSYGCEAEV